MEKCKNCKHYSVDDIYPQFGLCDNPIFEEVCGIPRKETLFLYWDNEGYSAGFRVHENFGCIGFKKK